MNAKEVRKGIEEANARSTIGGILIAEVVFTSLMAMVPIWHWIGAVIALPLLLILLVPRKTRRYGLVVLTLCVSLSVAYMFFLGTGIIGAVIAFIVTLLVIGFINRGFYGASLDDWEDEKREKEIIRR